jgi:hypothetical protein
VKPFKDVGGVVLIHNEVFRFWFKRAFRASLAAKVPSNNADSEYEESARSAVAPLWETGGVAEPPWSHGSWPPAVYQYLKENRFHKLWDRMVNPGWVDDNRFIARVLRARFVSKLFAGIFPQVFVVEEPSRYTRPYSGDEARWAPSESLRHWEARTLKPRSRTPPPDETGRGVAAAP